MLTVHLLTTAGKKMSLDKSLQIHAKSWKIILNPEDGYTNKEMKIEKRRKERTTSS